MDIYAIEKSSRASQIIKENLDLDIEIASELLETCKDIPFVGTIWNLKKFAINYLDWRFANRLAKFLRESADIDYDTKYKFWSSLSEKDAHRISNYLLNVLYTSDEDEKSKILGMIYKHRLFDRIDDDMMLRLCSVVNKSFVTDLKMLPAYVKKSTEETVEANNFICLGIIDNFVGGYWVNESSWQLNKIGLTLFEILEEEGWLRKN